MRLQKFGKKIKDTGTGRNRFPSRLRKGTSKGPHVRTLSPFGRSSSTSVTAPNIKIAEDNPEAQAAGHTGQEHSVTMRRARRQIDHCLATWPWIRPFT